MEGQREIRKARLARARVWFVIHLAFVALAIALCIRNPKASAFLLPTALLLAFMSVMNDLRIILTLAAGDDPDDC